MEQLIDFVEKQSKLQEFDFDLMYLIHYIAIIVTTALSFTTFHTEDQKGPKNKWVSVLAILIHLEHCLKLILMDN